MRKLGSASAATTAPLIGPDALQHAAQDRAVAAGGKLVAEETAKRQRHPLDRWDEVVDRAEAGQFPKGIDVFLTKYHGLFYVAPAQDSYMCRLRIPNGILHARQLRGLADAADSFGGGYADVTTRANLQIREIPARHAVDVLTGGAGARPHRARLRRRQHPQHHRQPDRRHRPAGADRHPAALHERCTTTSSITARCTACRASSTSPSTAAAACRCWRTPTTSASPRRVAARSDPASTSACSSAASPVTATSRATPACC